MTGPSSTEPPRRRLPAHRDQRTGISTFAPGRVNLIGDHTDHTGGWVLPMAIHLGTTVEAEVAGETVDLRSTWSGDTCSVAVDVSAPEEASPSWARYVAGVVAEMRPDQGLRGEISTTLPVGSGLSSSAALEVSVALALGFEGSAVELAQLCRRAEQRASGVPCGIMDQLASAAGVEGSALLIDCESLTVEPVLLPPDLAVAVVDSGQARTLATSAYADRQRACQEAVRRIGSLREAGLDDLDALSDPALRRRARHVFTENQRVLDMAEALRTGDAGTAGRLMIESHASLRDDFEVSTPVLDALVERLTATPGVWGARLTGAGFGGCVVALTEPGVALAGWSVQAAESARREPGKHAAWFAYRA